jgi:lysozyme family protein
MNFDAAFARLIGHEGGYVNDPKDPGGETKFGISKRSYPGENIANLTLERAKELAYRDYWGPAGCDAVPDVCKFDLFDMAYNSGPTRAIQTAQKACGETEDGILGPLTLQAIQSMHPIRFVARFNGARMLFMTDLKNWPAHGKGWMRRLGKNLLAL